MVRQLSWMLALGFPLVGLVHIAMGSFLSLQAYYGSTFIDGTGAVVGVGLLRNLGGLMTGMILAGILAARMIPELRRLAAAAWRPGTRTEPLPVGRPAGRPADRRGRRSPACCSRMWGIAVGTLVGWQASESMMGLPTETFFMMMLKMIWFRDVVGLVVKGLLFGLLPAAICCHEALRAGFREAELARRRAALHADAGGPAGDARSSGPTCLGIVAILIVNTSWFMLVYHAVPFYGPTLLEPPAPVTAARPARRHRSIRSPGGTAMSTRSSAREIWVGLVVVVALAGLLGLLGLASDGPGFLAPQRTIDVVFRDGQGIRVGSPVRVAGLDTGSVVDVDLVEVEGTLRARVRISLPADLAKKLRQDVKVTIQPSLTGQSQVNIVSTGRSSVALVPGRSIQGVETSFFDPILEQVGLGPGRAEPPEPHDRRGPPDGRRGRPAGPADPRRRSRRRPANLREMSDTIRPAVESTVGHVEDLTRQAQRQLAPRSRRSSSRRRGR